MAKKKLSFHEAAKIILQEFDYLHYNDITGIAIERGYIETKGETPENTMNAHIGTLDKSSNKNTFIRVGGGIYALREINDEDNLLKYIKYRLKSFSLWKIDKKDSEYLYDIFGKDIFENNKEYLFFLLAGLKKSGKIIGYQEILDDILITFKKEENIDKFNPVIRGELKKSIEKLVKESEKIKDSVELINKNSGIKELSEKFNKIGEELKIILPQVLPKGLIQPNNKTIEELDKLEKAFSGIYKNPILDNFSQIFNSVQESLKLLDTSKFTKIQLEEFKKVNEQINLFNKLLINPESFFDNYRIIESDGFNLPNTLPNSLGNNKKDYTHTFEGYIGNEGAFQIIRGTAKIKELEEVSLPKYYNEEDKSGLQRELDEKRAKNIKDYIKNSTTKFFPEVILGLHLRDENSIQINRLLSKEIKVDKFGGKKEIGIEEIKVNKDLVIKNEQIIRIDGNHRLSLSKELDDEDNIYVSFCFIIFDERKTKKQNIDEEILLNQEKEARLFYILNNTAVKVTSEHALKILANISDDERNNLYSGNNDLLRRTSICIKKYNSLKDADKLMALEYGKNPYSKIEVMMKYIEKYEDKENIKFTDEQILEILSIIQKSFQNINSKYIDIKNREDYLFLILNIYFDFKLNINDIPKEIEKFCDWILEKGFTNIVYSKEPVLWQVYKKETYSKGIRNIHVYEINSIHNNKLKVFNTLIEESRKKIILPDINKKQIGLDKIVDAFINLSTIIGGNEGYKNCVSLKDNMGNLINSINKTAGKILFSAIDKMDKKDQSKSVGFIETHFYSNLWEKVGNNDFYIRHSECDSKDLTKREMINDDKFIEFLYSEYDNAIRFILDKAGFLIK